MSEDWKPIPGFPGYEVSDAGRVRRDGSIRSLSPNSRGYVTVDLWHDGVATTKRVNRIVLEAFTGQAPAGAEARHDNGDRLDNRLANLSWGTHLDNMRDMVRHGTHANTVKAECPNKHPYDDTNTYTRRDGGRGCKECRREANRAFRARQRSAA